MKDMKVIIGLLAVLTVFVTCVMLKLGRNVFIPLVIAWFLSYMMSPAVRFFARRMVPPALTTLVLIAFLLCVAGLAGYFFKELIAGQAGRYALYYDRLQEILGRLTAQFSFLSVELDAKNVSLSDVQKMFFKVYYPVAHAVSYTVMALFFLMFMLIGINTVDLFNLKEIVDGRINYYRAKTNRLYSIKVEPEAMELINKHRGKKWLIDILDRYKDYKDYTKRINLALKKIGPYKRTGKGGVKETKPLFPEISTYWARHSWATIAASLDIPRDTIAHALGHGGNTVTDIYIDFDERKVDEANRKVLDWVLYGKK